MKKLGVLPLVAALVACSGPDDIEPGPTFVSSVAVDGFLVMLRSDGVGAGAGSLHLVDPSTGKASATEFFVGNAATVRLSPDGRRLAWVAPFDASTSSTPVLVAEAVLEDGLPALAVRQQIAAGVVDTLEWNSLGDRLYSRTIWMNPDTGETFPCEDSDSRPVSMRRPIIAFPGGHRYLCSNAHRLYDDGRYLGPLESTGDALTLDGQFLGGGFHIPTCTRRLNGASTGGVMLADGRALAAPAGKHGWTVSEESGGFVTLYKRLEIKELPVDASFTSVSEAFATGEATPQTFAVKDALLPWFNEHEGRAYQPVGVTKDGERIIYAVTSWVLQGDSAGGTNALYEVKKGSALVEVSKDGKSRGFRTQEVAPAFGYFSDDSSFHELDDGDWLVTGSLHEDGLSGMRRGAFGYVKGKPVYWRDVTSLSKDGGWFYGSDADHHCLRARGEASSQCFPRTAAGEALGFMGQGLKSAHAGDAPLLLSLSREAAWPGASVTIFGAHFGPAGTLEVGGVKVPASDVSAWSEQAITFTMSATLPSRGEVKVTAGKSSARGPVLTRTALATTPFDGVSPDPITLGQGLNAIDLGELGAFNAVRFPVALSPDLRDAQGRYLIFAEGAAVPTRVEVPLVVAPYARTLVMTVENRLADPTRWQPVSVIDGELSPSAAFVTLAGDLVERSSGTHPKFDGHVRLAKVKNRIDVGVGRELGMPDFWRVSGDRTWVTNDPDGTPTLWGWNVRQLTGWIGNDGQWGTPVYAQTPRFALPLYFQGVAADGDLVLFTGRDPMGEKGGAYQLSTDGGATRGDVVIVDEAVLPQKLALRDPVYVDAEEPFFLVFEADYQSPAVVGVHAISRDGAFTANVTAVPPDAVLNGGGMVRDAPTTVETSSGLVLMHYSKTNTLVRADFDTEASWSVVPAAADQKYVRSLYRDPTTQDVYAVKDDGSVQRATLAGGWNDWAAVDLGIELALPISALPHAVGKLPDGRWIVLATLIERSTMPSGISTSAWFVGPKP